jgi:DNA-binding GntR family transcriptional regulator
VDPRLYRHVYAVLSQRIAGGELAAGTRLNIGGLADEFDVSRDTVQRAMGLLADDGFVERWAGLGWYVTGPAA